MAVVEGLIPEKSVLNRLRIQHLERGGRYQPGLGRWPRLSAAVLALFLVTGPTLLASPALADGDHLPPPPSPANLPLLLALLVIDRGPVLPATRSQAGPIPQRDTGVDSAAPADLSSESILSIGDRTVRASTDRESRSPGITKADS